MGGYDFTGKTVWVTGGETPMGRQIAGMFAREGARLLISGVNDFADSDVICYEYNPTNEDHANNALALIDTLDITVIANRYIKKSSLLSGTVELFDEMIEKNLTHAWCATRATAGKIGKKRGGVILFITSIHGEKPSVSAPFYSMACGGVNMLMKEAAQDFGRLGIRCNQLRGGFLSGDDELFINELSNESLNEGLGFYHNFDLMIPRGAPGTLEEAGKAALFLCSDNASFINGATLTMDGGSLGFYGNMDAEERWDFGYVHNTGNRGTV